MIFDHDDLQTVAEHAINDLCFGQPRRSRSGRSLRRRSALNQGLGKRYV